MRLPLILAAIVQIQPIVSEDVLEPSVRNEVDHALSLAAAAMSTNSPAAAVSTPSHIAQPTTNAFVFVASPTNAVPGDIFGTNGLSATEIAIKLVSSQRADGRWLSGTNDVTAAAIQILLSL